MLLARHLLVVLVFGWGMDLIAGNVYSSGMPNESNQPVVSQHSGSQTNSFVVVPQARKLDLSQIGAPLFNVNEKSFNQWYQKVMALHGHWLVEKAKTFKNDRSEIEECLTEDRTQLEQILYRFYGDSEFRKAISPGIQILGINSPSADIFNAIFNSRYFDFLSKDIGMNPTESIDATPRFTGPDQSPATQRLVILPFSIKDKNPLDVIKLDGNYLTTLPKSFNSFSHLKSITLYPQKFFDINLKCNHEILDTLERKGVQIKCSSSQIWYRNFL